MRQAPRVVSEQQPADRYQGAGEPASAGGTEPVAIPITKPPRAGRTHAAQALGGIWEPHYGLEAVGQSARIAALGFDPKPDRRSAAIGQSHQARITDAQPKPHHGFVSVSEFKIPASFEPAEQPSREPASADGAGAVERIESRQQQDRGIGWFGGDESFAHAASHRQSDCRPATPF